MKKRTEFNLSEKIQSNERYSWIYPEDVKEFIKKLKEKGKTTYKNPFEEQLFILSESDFDALAGEKLI